MSANTALSEALSAIDAAFAAPAPKRTDAEFRAFHFAAARRLLAELRSHRDWVAAHGKANPVGPSVSCFYRDLAPERIARRMAEVSRHRRLAARGLMTLSQAVA